MGIPSLRETIEACEEIIPIAKLAEDHYNRFQKPFRIAVDEADWRFHNLTPEKVAFIRRSEPAANPIEKAIFHRICKLLTLNIRLVFVFDGPGAPAKRGRDGRRKVNYKERELLKEILDALRLPYLEAPGEAEAECCRLQNLDLVDAVWSQDSDCLMFGCTLWLRDHRTAKEAGNESHHVADTAKDEKTVRVVRAESLQTRFRLNRKGCVLFAMLAGGDYNTLGLPKCGAGNALKAAQSGLGLSLCSRQSQQECKEWRDRVLTPFFKRISVNIAIPEDFPRFDMLQLYNSPKVHPDEYLRNNPRLNAISDQRILEVQLLAVICPRLNIWWKKYMDKVGPVLLSRYLANRDRSLPREAVYGIKLVKARGKQTGDGSQPHVLEHKLSFTPFGVTALRQADFGNFDNLRHKAIPPIDPSHRVCCEIPAFLLRKVMPLEMLERPVAQTSDRPSKRKHQTSPRHAELAPSTKKRKSQGGEPKATEASIRTPSDRNSQFISPHQALTTPTKQHLAQTPMSGMSNVIDLSNSIDDPELRLPPSRPSKSAAIHSTEFAVVDLDSQKQTVDEISVQGVIGSNQQPLDSPYRSHNPDVTLPLDMDELEEMQLQAAMRLSLGLPYSVPPSPTASEGNVPLRLPQSTECIDLTED